MTVEMESSWLRQLERMNAVHRGHDRERFMANRMHFVLSFHDSTFECIANGYRVMSGVGPIAESLGPGGSRGSGEFRQPIC